MIKKIPLAFFGLFFTTSLFFILFKISQNYIFTQPEPQAEFADTPMEVNDDDVEVADPMPTQTYDPTVKESELTQMGIESITPPSALGTPFIVHDFPTEPLSDSPSDMQAAEKVRMTVLGFKNYQQWGSAWGALNIVSAHYTFTRGMEYDRHGSKTDYEKLKSGELKGSILVDGVQGLVRYEKHVFFGLIEKVVVFPFKDRYISVNYFFQEGPHNTEAIIQDLYLGKYPPEEKIHLEYFDQLVESLRFTERQ